MSFSYLEKAYCHTDQSIRMTYTLQFWPQLMGFLSLEVKERWEIEEVVDPYPHYFEKTFALTPMRETNSLQGNLNIYSLLNLIQDSLAHSLCAYPTMTPLHYMATLQSPT